MHVFRLNVDGFDWRIIFLGFFYEVLSDLYR